MVRDCIECWGLFLLEDFLELMTCGRGWTDRLRCLHHTFFTAPCPRPSRLESELFGAVAVVFEWRDNGYPFLGRIWYILTMKSRLILVVLLFCFIVIPVTADIGAGIVLGSPSGVSVLIDNRVAVAAAWNIENRLHLHGDLWLFRQTLSDPLDWYVGVGGKVLLMDDPSLGVRIPVGLQWYATPEIELFAEVAPGLRIVPNTVFDIDGGVGVRFHF